MSRQIPDVFDVLVDDMKKIGVEERIINTAVGLHSKLTIARALAKSIYGNDWEPYVMDVYGHLRDELASPLPVLKRTPR